jgi:hypothetical protein
LRSRIRRRLPRASRRRTGPGRAAHRRCSLRVRSGSSPRGTSATTRPWTLCPMNTMWSTSRAKGTAFARP